MIKLVKLFGILAGAEARLVKKLFEPFVKLLTNNSAKSVEFEIVRTVLIYMKE